MKNQKPILYVTLGVFLVILMLCVGCSGGGSDDGDVGANEVAPDTIAGDAILDLYVVDGGHDGTPPDPSAGYTLLDIDLNEGTGGNYIWLYYKMGKADGSEGEPVSRIYTVDEYDGETPQGGTKLPVNLNHCDNVTGGHEPLWLYYMRSSWPVARCRAIKPSTRKA